MESIPHKWARGLTPEEVSKIETDIDWRRPFDAKMIAEVEADPGRLEHRVDEQERDRWRHADALKKAKAKLRKETEAKQRLSSGVPEVDKLLDDATAKLTRDFLPKGIDRRTRHAQRTIKLIDDVTSIYGGYSNPTPPQREIVKRIASLTIEAEKLEAAQLRGEEIDAARLGTITHHLGRAYAALGEKVEKKKEEKPSLFKFDEWLASLSDTERAVVTTLAYALAKDPDPATRKKAEPISMRRLTHPRDYDMMPETFAPVPKYEPSATQEIEYVDGPAAKFDAELADTIARVFG